MQNKKGFTLIELLVVVAIIGLLSTLGVIAFRSAQQKARDTKRMGDVKAVINALAQANQEGLMLCGAACAAAPASGLVSAYAICKPVAGACSSVATDEDKNFINFTNLKDPMSSWTGECADGATNCSYGFTGSPKVDSFRLNFATEMDPVAGLKTGQKSHYANQNGMVE